MSGFGSISDIASDGDRASWGDCDGAFRRVDCEIAYVQPGCGPEDIVIRDILMRYAECGHA